LTALTGEGDLLDFVIASTSGMSWLAYDNRGHQLRLSLTLV